MKTRAVPILAVAALCGMLSACSAHPVRVSCGDQLRPINIHVPSASEPSGAKPLATSPAARSSTDSPREVPHGR